MSVVVSETDATKPRKARVKDGVVVAMGDPAADAGHSARIAGRCRRPWRIVACARAPGFYLPAFVWFGAAASPFRAAVSNGSVTIVPSENSVVLMPDLKSSDTDCGSGAGRATSTTLSVVSALARA